MALNETRQTDGFTQGCRDFLRTFTFEDILACTIYAPSLVFMVGPAAVVATDPVMSVALQSLIGFSLGWLLHRMGHRLLAPLPQGPQGIFLSRSLRLPVRLTLGQFVWLLELVVGGAIFMGLVGKRGLVAGHGFGLVGSLVLIALGVALFFLPVHLGRLWIARYYPAMSLVGPTDDVIKASFPSLRSLLKR